MKKSVIIVEILIFLRNLRLRINLSDLGVVYSSKLRVNKKVAIG